MKTIFGRSGDNYYLPQLKQNQRVEFDMDGIIGKGTICGITGADMPIVGKTYIILPDNLIENSEYSHICIPEFYLNPINIMVDLRECKAGDKLLSRHGLVLEYVRVLPEGDYMDHEVKYPNGSFGSRTHDGFVFRKKRMEIDHDIVEILK